MSPIRWCCLPILLLVAGCSKPSLVGTWDVASLGHTTTETFKADGTYTLVTDSNGLKTKQTGTWTADNGELILTGTGVSYEGANAVTKKVFGNEKADQATSPPVTFPFRWTSNDSLEVTYAEDTTMVLRREK